MTVDELVELTEAVFEEIGFSLAALRGETLVLGGLTDDQFAMALRFIAGERPALTSTVISEAVNPRPRRERQLVSIGEDELAERLAKLEELDEETPAGPVDIGDGVTLGL